MMGHHHRQESISCVSLLLAAAMKHGSMMMLAFLQKAATMTFSHERRTQNFVQARPLEPKPYTSQCLLLIFSVSLPISPSLSLSLAVPVPLSLSLSFYFSFMLMFVPQFELDTPMNSQMLCINPSHATVRNQAQTQNAELQPICRDFNVPGEVCNHAAFPSSAWYWLEFGEGCSHAGSAVFFCDFMDEAAVHNHAGSCVFFCHFLTTVCLRGFVDAADALPADGVSQWHVQSKSVERRTLVELLEDWCHA